VYIYFSMLKTSIKYADKLTNQTNPMLYKNI